MPQSWPDETGNGTYVGAVNVNEILEVGTENPDNLDITGPVYACGNSELAFDVVGLLPCEHDTLTVTETIDFIPGSTCKIVLHPSVDLAQLSTLDLMFGSGIYGTTDVVVVDPGGTELARVNNYDVSATESCVGALADTGGPTVDSLCPCQGPADTSDPWKTMANMCPAWPMPWERWFNWGNSIPQRPAVSYPLPHSRAAASESAQAK